MADRSSSPYTEKQKEFLIAFMECIKVKQTFPTEAKQPQTAEDLDKTSLYETTHHLLFSHYQVSCLKARNHKTKILYMLNAFRSIQKRIALELRELATRDRVAFDVETEQPKEKATKSLFENDEKPAENEEDSILKHKGKSGV